MSEIKAIIFDLDGTLVNSLEDIANSVNHVLEKFGMPTHEFSQFKYFIGRGMKNLITQALPKSQRSENQIQAYLNAMLEYYGAHCTDKTQLYKGIPELLDQLKDKNIKLAILSNKIDNLTKQIANAVLQQWNFMEVLGASESYPIKPSPEGALLISERIDIAPENILFVGDSHVDYETGQNSGMKSVCVSWGFRTKKDLIDKGVATIIDHPNQLLDYI